MTTVCLSVEDRQCGGVSLCKLHLVVEIKYTCTGKKIQNWSEGYSGSQYVRTLSSTMETKAAFYIQFFSKGNRTYSVSRVVWQRGSVQEYLHEWKWMSLCVCVCVPAHHQGPDQDIFNKFKVIALELLALAAGSLHFLVCIEAEELRVIFKLTLLQNWDKEKHTHCM